MLRQILLFMIIGMALLPLVHAQDDGHIALPNPTGQAAPDSPAPSESGGGTASGGSGGSGSSGSSGGSGGSSGGNLNYPVFIRDNSEAAKSNNTTDGTLGTNASNSSAVEKNALANGAGAPANAGKNNPIAGGSAKSAAQPSSGGMESAKPPASPLAASLETTGDNNLMLLGIGGAVLLACLIGAALIFAMRKNTKAKTD